MSTVEDAMLTLEASWWTSRGAKQARIRDEFEMTPTRYYQLLNALLDKPAAAAAHPLTVARLRRLREARKAERTATPPT